MHTIDLREESAVPILFPHRTIEVDCDDQSADGVVNTAQGAVHSAQDAVSQSPTIFDTKKSQGQWKKKPRQPRLSVNLDLPI